MELWSSLFQVIHKWRKQAIRTKLLIISPILIIITSIIGVWAINLASHEPSSDITHFFVGTGLHIKDEEVYANGTINFSVYCKVTVSGGYAIPEGILYNITQTCHNCICRYLPRSCRNGNHSISNLFSSSIRDKRVHRGVSWGPLGLSSMGSLYASSTSLDRSSRVILNTLYF